MGGEDTGGHMVEYVVIHFRAHFLNVSMIGI